MKLPVQPPKYDRTLEQQRSGVLEREVDSILSMLRPLAEKVKWGTGAPESVVVARIGSVYLRLDGGASTSLYVKEAGDGLATGWQAK